MAAKQTTTKPKHSALKGRFSIKNSRPVKRARALRAKRAHKSFLLTRRRDKPQYPPLPGYIAFTLSVVRMIKQHWRQFAILLVLYVVIALVLIGVTQQNQLRSVTDAMEEINQQAGENVIDTVTKVTGLFGATLVGSLNTSLTDVQQFYMAIVYCLMWLVIVWLLRHLIAGNVVRVRDALYNAGAPFISTLCILSLMLLQLLPGALGVFVFSLATQNGIFSDGVAAMCFGILAILLIVLSMYWLTSSFFALLIVTIPGTYPMAAIRGAAELALGRRLQLLLRLVWLALLLLLLWAVLLIPALLIDAWVKLSWLPLVTIVVEVATAGSFIVGVSYIYLLYRRMVDDTTQ